MKKLLVLALLIPLAALGADLNCSVKASKTTKKADLTAMAKVKDSDARKSVLDSFKASGATITKGALGVEEGCLVYSYDVQLPGKKGAEEVLVDAGTGKVLLSQHESRAKETAERAGEKVKDTAKKAVDKTKEVATSVKDEVREKR